MLVFKIVPGEIIEIFKPDPYLPYVQAVGITVCVLIATGLGCCGWMLLEWGLRRWMGYPLRRIHRGGAYGTDADSYIRTR